MYTMKHNNKPKGQEDIDMKNIPNVTIYDNGAGFGVMVDNLMVAHFRALGDAWRHIEWMYKVAQQEFTVSDKKTPVKQWVENVQWMIH